MLIRQIVLEDFLGHRGKVAFKLGPITLLVGRNEAGKSSILDGPTAVRYGSCREIPVKDNKLLRNRDSDKRSWRVAMQVSDPDVDDAETVTLKRTSTSGEAVKTLDGFFGDRRVFKALRRVSHFLDMKPQERKALVSDLIASDSDDLVERLVEEGAAEEIVEAVRSGNMRRAHRLAQDERAEVSRDVKQYEAWLDKAVEEPIIHFAKGPRKAGSIEMAELEKMKGKISEAKRKVDESERRYEEWADLQERAEKARVRRDELVGDDGAPTWTKADDKALEGVGKTIGEARADVAAHKASADGYARVYERMKALLVDRNKDPRCPMCNVPLDKAAKERIKDEMSTANLSSQTERTKQMTAAQELKAREKDQRELLSRKAEASRNRGPLNQLKLLIQEAERAQEPKTMSKSSAEMQAALHRCEQAITTKRDYERDLKRHAEAAEKLAEAKEAYEGVQQLVAMVDPANAAGIDKASGVINEKLGAWWADLFGHDEDELRSPLEIKPDWTITFYDAPISMACKSERERAGLLFAACLAAMSGVRLLLMDDFEHMDPQNRGRALKLCRRWIKEGFLHQVIVASVPNKAREDIKMPGWITALWVSPGKVEAL